MLKLTVFGTAAPQGSTRAFLPKGWKRPIVTADSKRTKPWRQAIVDVARDWAATHGPWTREIALELAVVFYLPRPKSAPRRVTEPATRPDLDKLIRSIGDALTDAGVWTDDAQVVETMARKVFAGGPRDPLGAAGPPRAEIIVRVAKAPPIDRALFEEVV